MCSLVVSNATVFVGTFAGGFAAKRRRGATFEAPRLWCWCVHQPTGCRTNLTIVVAGLVTPPGQHDSPDEPRSRASTPAAARTPVRRMGSALRGNSKPSTPIKRTPSRNSNQQPYVATNPHAVFLSSQLTGYQTNAHVETQARFIVQQSAAPHSVSRLCVDVSAWQ